MKFSSFKWLLCATILSSQPVFAEDVVKPETDNPPPTIVTAPMPAVTGFSLNDAIAKALSQSPRLKGFSSGIDAAKGERRQAGAWINPSVGVEAENLTGTGPYKGTKSAEVTYGVSQQFQLGGKISARENIADRGLEIASLDQKAAALDIIRDVTIAYAEVVAAEENARLAREQKDLANDVLKSVSVRVNAAAAPLMQKSRAEVERASAAIALDKATREGAIARKKLAALMGEERFTQTLDTTAFYTTDKPELAGLEDKLKANPDLVKLESSYEQSKARLDLEKANAIPDPLVSVGMRDFRDSGDQAFVVGVSLPIPVLNANRGNIAKAQSEVTRTELDNRQFALNTNAELTQARERMENTHLQAETIRTEILSSADKAFKLSREGYNLGRFPYLEVLDAQRSLFAVKQQQIDAIREFHTAKAQVERLTAAHANDLTKMSQENVPLVSAAQPSTAKEQGDNHAE